MSRAFVLGAFPACLCFLFCASMLTMPAPALAGGVSIKVTNVEVMQQAEFNTRHRRYQSGHTSWRLSLLYLAMACCS